MTQDEKTTQSILEMSPQLIAFEAMLGTIRPKISDERLEAMRWTIMTEQCRLADEALSPRSRHEKLLETIQAAETEEISVSLNQYARQVRFSSALTGGFIGMMLGAIFTILLLIAVSHYFANNTSTIQPVREIHHYMLYQDQNGNPIFPEWPKSDSNRSGT